MDTTILRGVVKQIAEEPHLNDMLNQMHIVILDSGGETLRVPVLAPLEKGLMGKEVEIHTSVELKNLEWNSVYSQTITANGNPMYSGSITLPLYVAREAYLPFF